MFVTVRGRRNGEAIERSWHLIAEGNDGPLIASMAAATIVRRCLGGNPPPAGARSAVNDLGIADYEALFRERKIVTGVRETRPAAKVRRSIKNPWGGLGRPAGFDLCHA